MRRGGTIVVACVFGFAVGLAVAKLPEVVWKLEVNFTDALSLALTVVIAVLAHTILRRSETRTSYALDSMTAELVSIERAMRRTHETFLRSRTEPLDRAECDCLVSDLRTLDNDLHFFLGQAADWKISQAAVEGCKSAQAALFRYKCAATGIRFPGAGFVLQADRVRTVEMEFRYFRDALSTIRRALVDA